MIVCYSTQRRGFDQGMQYRNPRYFDKVRDAPAKVVVIGDWPGVVEAYRVAGVPVETQGAVKPPEVVTDQDIAKMRKPVLAEKLRALGIDPPGAVADMRAVYRTAVIADDRPPLGPIIGDEKFRTVFEHATDPSLVVKIEKSRNANKAEWKVWQAIKGTEYEPHFAPVYEIGDGWLTQARAKPHTGSPPERIPAICSTDATRRNFGILDGRTVCVDMGGMSPQSVTPNARFRGTNWRS